ncbi:hypothetical protein E4U19_002874 [Claviceps sp. Clav32 group G5]|nr:hypothetical protein E4U19_002874 [Claviceps sp. Clav32 group G5]
MRRVFRLQLRQRFGKGGRYCRLSAALILTTSLDQPPPSHVNSLCPLPGLANIVRQQSVMSQKSRPTSSRPLPALANIAQQQSLASQRSRPIPSRPLPPLPTLANTARQQYLTSQSNLAMLQIRHVPRPGRRCDDIGLDFKSPRLYKEQCISKDHVLIKIDATWEGKFSLDNSRSTPIGEGHDDETSAAIHGHLDSGDFDEQYANDEAICELDLTQVHSEEERDLPPLPPASPSLGRKEYPSTYHRLMDMMHDHRQKRRRTT